MSRTNRQPRDPWRTPGHSNRWDKPYRVLTEDQVAEIRRRCAAGESRQDVAADFDVSRSHVSRIVLGHRRRGQTCGK